MSDGFRKFLQMPATERRLLMALALLQPVASASLRLFGYKATLRGVERLSPSHQPDRHASPSELQDAQRLAELAAIAGQRGPLATTCLHQALVVHGLLRRRGLAPCLRLGVDVLERTPDMHAWVELDGTPLAQPNLRHRPF